MHGMTGEQWRRIKAIAADALVLSAPERASYISMQCAGDNPLQCEVESLVGAMVAASTLYDEPQVTIAGTGAFTDGVPANLLPSTGGTRVGPYRIVRVIGHGGMGTVYLAERADNEFEQQVAIKFVGIGIQSAILLDRFREERRILAALEHPNIARLLDGGTTPDGIPYVVMEYVQGVAIDEYCETRGLSVRERITLFLLVCDAVHFAHRRLVIHRDLKAANILVSDAGVPKLLDFGVAKLATPATADASPTIVRAWTPESASPEQVRGEPVTIATDIYSLGVLLYRLLARRLPYAAVRSDETSLMHAICDVMPDPPSAAATIDRDLDLIVLMALRKEPDRRYSTVLQFANDLEWYLQGRPVLAAPDSGSYRARKFLSRHRLAVSAAAVASVAVFGGASLAIWQARIARQERAAAQQRLDMVRQLAESVVFDVNGALQNVPGALQARKLVVSKALDYLNQLRGQAASDAALGEQLAAAYLKVGDIQGNPYQPNIGDQRSALDSYAQSQALYDRLAASSSSASILRGRVAVREAIGDVRWSLGEFDQALSTYREELALAQAMSMQQPQNDGFRSLVAKAHYRVGQAQLRNRDLAGAAQTYDQVVKLFTQLAVSRPENYESAHDLATGRLKIGDVQLEQGAFERAYETYAQAERDYLAFVKQHGDQDDSPRIASMLALRTSSSLTRIGRYQEAEREARFAVEQLLPRLHAASGDTQAADDEGYARMTLGDALAGEQRDDEALNEYTQAIKAYRMALVANPKYIEARRELGMSLSASGHLALRKGNTQLALDSYREAMPLLEAADVRPQVLDTLALLYLRCGDAQAVSSRSSGREQDEARRSFLKSQSLWTELGSNRQLTQAELRLQNEADAKTSR